jgi:hypothetical protein
MKRRNIPTIGKTGIVLVRVHRALRQKTSRLAALVVVDIVVTVKIDLSVRCVTSEKKGWRYVGFLVLALRSLSSSGNG